MQIYNNNKNVQKHLSEHTHVSSMRYEGELRMILRICQYLLLSQAGAFPDTVDSSAFDHLNWELNRKIFPLTGSRLPSYVFCICMLT